MRPAGLESSLMQTKMRKIKIVVTSLTLLAGILAAPAAFSQAPPVFAPPQLDDLVGRIALYPESLVAQILAAATYSNDIPQAAQWADQHHYLTGQTLANAITADQLPWDPSVQALLPFPSVLDMMASDPNWTSQIGNAFLAQQQEVMDAIQRRRAEAARFGYLRTNAQVVVNTGPYIYDRVRESGLYGGALLRPRRGVFCAAPRICGGRRDPLRLRRDDRRLLRPVGLGAGRHPLRLGLARRFPEQRALGPDVG